MKNCRSCQSIINKNKDNFLTLKNSPSIIQNLNKSKIEAKKQKVDLKIYECSNCGLIQLLNNPTKYYKCSIRSPFLTKQRINEINSKFKYIKKKFPNSRSVIEIGAGRGEYLNLAKNYFRDILGTEFSKQLIERKVTNIKIRKFYPLDKSNLKQNKIYDGLYCLNFLEHSPQPDKFLKKIIEPIKKNGFIYVEVPNIEYMIENKIMYDFTIEHLSYFNKNSLELLFRKNNIKIIRSFINRNGHNICILGKIKKNKNLNKINIEIKRFIKNLNNKTNLLKGKTAIWGACHHTFEILMRTNLRKKINYIVDSNNEKEFSYSPGSSIKILNPNYLKKSKPQNLIISASSYSNEVMKIVKRKFLFIKKIYLFDKGKLIKFKK